MDLLETNDIKAHIFLTDGLCKWKFHVFMDIFAFSWIFFLLPGLTQGKCPISCIREIPGSFCPFAVDLKSCKRMAVYEHSWSS